MVTYTLETISSRSRFGGSPSMQTPRRALAKISTSHATTAPSLSLITCTSTHPAARAIRTMWSVPPCPSAGWLSSRTEISDTREAAELNASCNTQRFPRSHSFVPVPWSHRGSPTASLSCKRGICAATSARKRERQPSRSLNVSAA